MSRLLVLDTETGGLNPELHSLLSFGAVIWDDGKLGAELEVFVAEPEIHTEREAMALNAIDVSWLKAHGYAPARAVQALEEFVSEHFSGAPQVVVAGHNVNFDVRYMRRLYRLARTSKAPPFSHRVLDTASVLQFLSLADRLSPDAVGSSAAFKHFGIQFAPGTRHTALSDARATAQLLTALVELVRRVV